MHNNNSTPIEKRLEQLTKVIEAYQQELTLLKQNYDLLAGLPECCIQAGDILSFHGPLSREDTTKILLAFPGRWEKELNNSQSVTYSLHPLDGPFRSVYIFRGCPPPSCRIVEEEVEVPAQPAHVAKIKRLVCQEAQ